MMARDPNPIPTPLPGKPRQERIQPFPMGEGLGSAPAAKAAAQRAGSTPRTPATPAPGDGHTTSGLDRAMQDHADRLHPVKGQRAGATAAPDMD